MKRTKIVCTIGPASSTEETLRAMIKAGMNVARLNFSHGTYEEHAAFIALLRKLSKEEGEPLAILQDLQGPKIRTGNLPKEGVQLIAGERVIFTTGEADIPKKLPVTYAKLHEDVRPGERLLFDDGLLSARVVSVEGQDIACEVIDGGTLFSHKGMNFPETVLNVSAITEKDAADARFGVEQGVDWLALSFVRTRKEIDELRSMVAAAAVELGKGSDAPVRILAKVEKPQAVQNMEEIVDAVDGVMVARGDLGIEMPAEDVPIIQKRLISACLAAAKPVIVATQMLDSMIRNPRATRAEVSDVANAVIDHADAVMLSGETAGGKYPVQAVETMARVVAEVESSGYDDLDPSKVAPSAGSVGAVAHAAATLAAETRAAAIIAVAPSEETVRSVSRCRPERPIYAAVRDARVMRQLNLSWGVRPMLLTEAAGPRPIDAVLEELKEGRALSSGEAVVVIGHASDAEYLELRTVA